MPRTTIEVAADLVGMAAAMDLFCRFRPLNAAVILALYISDPTGSSLASSASSHLRDVFLTRSQILKELDPPRPEAVPRRVLARSSREHGEDSQNGCGERDRAAHVMHLSAEGIRNRRHCRCPHSTPQRVRESESSNWHMVHAS